MGNLRPAEIGASPANLPKTCPYGGGQFEINPQGVYFHPGSKEASKDGPQWICSPLHVVAKTRDENGTDWGRLLQWQDDDGRAHGWAVPQELLEGDATEVRKELARQGPQIAPGRVRDLLLAYIKIWPVGRRARCVTRLGWHGTVFVISQGGIGTTNEEFAYQNAHATDVEAHVSGSAESWREEVARKATGNSRLVFAIGTAFAGPMLYLAGEDSGGFHLRGASSSGKSTALRVAASVWGDPTTFIRLWRTTTNGLEGLASRHSDGLLILDELSQVEPHAVGDAAYLLANGQGKTRATKHGTARVAQQWRLLFLSAGEESLPALAAQANKRATAGQELRLADIEGDAGAGLGLFESLHGESQPAQFAQALRAATAQHHGAVGFRWLEEVVKHQDAITAKLPARLGGLAQSWLPPGATGQVERVARRFALVAIAGEWATRFGLTGWSADEACRSTKACFESWLANFGGTKLREDQEILSHVRGFLVAHGASRFDHLHAISEQRIANRAGFYRDNTDGGREYLFLPDTFRQELCKGFDERLVKRTLQNAGMLIPGKDGRATQVTRLPTISGGSRVYVVRYDDGNRQ